MITPTTLGNELITNLLVDAGIFDYLQRTGMPKDTAQQFIENYSAFLTNDRSCRCISVGQLTRMEGFLIFRRADWDSEQFGIEMGKIEHLGISHTSYHEALDVAQRLLSEFETQVVNDYPLYCTCRTESDRLAVLHALEKSGFQHLGVLVTLGQSTDKVIRCEPEHDIAVRPFREDDLNKIQDIAKEAFRFDRFHSDPFLPKNPSSLVWATSLKNAVAGRAAQVLVAEKKSDTAGFIVLEYDRLLEKYLHYKLGVIYLIAISSKFQGQGIGRYLISAAIEWFRKQDVYHVTVGAQLQNYPALKVYQSMGFQVVHSQITYRKVYNWDQKKDYAPGRES